jgi:hypothetical protein
MMIVVRPSAAVVESVIVGERNAGMTPSMFRVKMKRKSEPR